MYELPGMVGFTGLSIFRNSFPVSIDYFGFALALNITAEQLNTQVIQIISY